VLAGYLVMMLVGALSYGALRMVGSASPDTLAQGEAFATIISPTAADWVISAGGAVAGLLLITAFRDAVIPGALIALALVPAAALVGVGVASGQPDVALGALRRVALDVTLVIVLGGAVVLLKQRLVHRNRPPMS
jgi:uncharacterized membrane protein